MENKSKTVNRAIDILEIFIHKDGPLSLTELSRFSKLNTATCYRLISTLMKRGYITRLQNGLYTLGLKMLDFSFALRRGMKFIDFAYACMSKLSKKYNESVFIVVLHEDKSLVVEEVCASEDLRINSPIGKRLDLYCTACGKILLTSLSENDRKSYYNRTSFHQFTKNTIIDSKQLEKELQTIKREGIAFANEEYRMGIWAAAAPVYKDSGDIIAAVGILVLTSNLNTRNIKKFSNAIKSCSAEISQIIARIS